MGFHHPKFQCYIKLWGVGHVRDKTSWVHQGLGEAKIGLTLKIMNKPGLSKVGKIVVVTDLDRV